MLPDLHMFIKAVSEKKVKKPANKSYEIVSKCISDNLIVAKLAALISISKVVEPFLTTYQTDLIMLPYLVEELEVLLRKVVSRFRRIKGDETGQVLTTLDLSDEWLPWRKIEVGFVAEKSIKELLSKKKLSELQHMHFRENCRNFLKALAKKMLEKCPLKYRLVRALICMNPEVMSGKPSIAQTKFKDVLGCMVKTRHVDEQDADELSAQYTDFVSNLPVEFKTFDSNICSLDQVFSNCFPKGKYPKLWNLMRILLILSHGQAAVERGFSIGKSLAKENQQKETVKGLKVVKDHILSVGGIKNVVITDQMIQHVSGANRRYLEYLESKKRQSVEEKAALKRKNGEAEIEELKRKKKLLDVDIISLQKQYTELYDKAETHRKFELIVSANALRKKADEKEAEKNELDKKVREKIVEQQMML